MNVPDIKSVVVERIEKAITTDFSVTERSWVFKYQHLSDHDKTLMITRLLRTINDCMSEEIKEGKRIQFPRLGIFEIKTSKLKAIDFRKAAVEARGVENFNELSDEDKTAVVNEVMENMRNYKNNVRRERNKPITLKIIDKKLA